MSIHVEYPSLDKVPRSAASSLTNISERYDKSGLPDDKVEVILAKLNLEDEWENDPVNPRNWSAKKKWIATAIVSFYTFISPLASSMMAPGLPEIAVNFRITDSTVVALTLSIYLLAFGIGPLVLAPLSEMYGRTWVLHIGNLLTVGFSLGCAYAPTTGALIGFRFLAGLAGSAPIAVGGGSIGDLFSENDRASAMAFYSLGPLIGPVVGPITGGFIAQTVGVKWVFIVMASLSGVAAAIAIPLLRETYAPIIRRRRAEKYNDREAAVSNHSLPNEDGNFAKLYYLWLNLSRPIILLFGSLICFALSLYIAFIYGIYYLMFTTFPEFFATTYHFKPGVGGLAYIGLGVGFLSAAVFGARVSDKIYQHLANKNDGIVKPEMRIPVLFFGSIFVPIGLFWYGWSAAAKLHWIMPILGAAVFGFGMATSFMTVQLYLVDTFAYAASATSATALFRSLFGFGFPLFGQQMFDALGQGGANSLLAGLAIVLGIPFPIWIYYKGEKMRARNPLTKASTIPKKIS